MLPCKIIDFSFLELDLSSILAMAFPSLGLIIIRLFPISKFLSAKFLRDVLKIFKN